MKALLACSLFTLLPLSKAYAATVPIEVSEEVSYDNITTYTDGMTFVDTPRLYGYFLSSETIGAAMDTGKVFCQKIGLTYYDNQAKRLPYYENSVAFAIDEKTGEVSGPRFTSDLLVIDRLICKR